MILARLLSGELAVTELARPFEMTLPAVTKHLKVLEAAGLIARSRSAQWRPCRLEPAALNEAVRWLDRYRLPHKSVARRAGNVRVVGTALPHHGRK
jgi:DNA-binding transcriptional ArsR family regulator